MSELLSEFDQRLSVVDEAQDEYEYVIELSTLDDVIDEASVYRDTCSTWRVKAVKVLSKCQSLLTG